MVLTKTREKEIRSLKQKKYRKDFNEFFVEGGKNVLEVVASSLKVLEIYCTDVFFAANESKLTKKCENIAIVSEAQLVKLGTFSSNDAGVALVQMPTVQISYPEKNNHFLVLDEVKDPGNLGTIIRIADWYGIKKIICSKECVDSFNPKVLNSSMGSFARVEVAYCDLSIYLKNYNGNIYGAFLDGENIYNSNLESSGLIVMGNESQGISHSIKGLINKKLLIPRIGGAESLNVGVATAVILDNFQRS